MTVLRLISRPYFRDRTLGPARAVTAFVPAITVSVQNIVAQSCERTIALRDGVTVEDVRR
jgi:hypothetical protein